MYQRQFFDFFEDIIQHHLPDIEVKPLAAFEPRTQRPPEAPSLLDSTPGLMHEWDSEFLTEVKCCGKALQCHQCK